MKLLAIDTSSRFFCMGLSEGEKVYEYRLELGRRLSSLLVPTIGRALEAVGWAMEDIDYFGCGIGPGSFTGIRVGLAAIKGFSWALKKPVVGISSLDMLAQSITDQVKKDPHVLLKDTLIIPLIDAKRSLAYTAFYAVKGATLKQVEKPFLASEAEFSLRLNKKSIRSFDRIFISGDGLAAWPHASFKSASPVVCLDRDYWYPQPETLVARAKEKIRLKQVTTTFTTDPLYLYPKECQIRQVTNKKTR